MNSIDNFRRKASQRQWITVHADRSCSSFYNSKIWDDWSGHNRYGACIKRTSMQYHLRSTWFEKSVYISELVSYFPTTSFWFWENTREEHQHSLTQPTWCLDIFIFHSSFLMNCCFGRICKTDSPVLWKTLLLEPLCISNKMYYCCLIAYFVLVLQFRRLGMQRMHLKWRVLELMITFGGLTYLWACSGRGLKQSPPI